jgi:hypothetical protein
MNESSSPVFLACYQMKKGFVSVRSRCTEMTEHVLPNDRLSPNRRLFLRPNFPQDTTQHPFR